MSHFNIGCTKIHRFELFFQHRSSSFFQTSSHGQCTKVSQTSNKEVFKIHKTKKKTQTKNHPNNYILTFPKYFLGRSLRHSAEGCVVTGKCSKAVPSIHPSPVPGGQRKSGRARCHLLLKYKDTDSFVTGINVLNL